MRCYVEPSPAGGYFVRLRGEPAPLSRHDTEEEAEAAAAVYERGLAREDTAEHVVLADGSEVRIRPVQAEDEPQFEPAFSTEIDHVDREAIGAIAGGRGVGVARYERSAERPHAAEAAVTVVGEWQHRGLGGKLLRRLCARATENGLRVFTARLLADDEAALTPLERLGRVTAVRRDGPAIAVDVELPLELPALEHLLRAAAGGAVRTRLPRP